jgi:hypothetical protein
MSFSKVRLRPLGGVIRMGMIEADDVFSAVAALALDANQFFGVDVVAIVCGIGTCIASTDNRGDDACAVAFHLAEKNAAAFMWISQFAMLAKGFVVFAIDFQHDKFIYHREHREAQRIKNFGIQSLKVQITRCSSSQRGSGQLTNAYC